jgi:hypothetical protein
MRFLLKNDRWHIGWGLSVPNTIDYVKSISRLTDQQQKVDGISHALLSYFEWVAPIPSIRPSI